MTEVGKSAMVSRFTAVVCHFRHEQFLALSICRCGLIENVVAFLAPLDRMADHHLEDGFRRGALTRPYEEALKKHSARALARLIVDGVGAPLSKFQQIEAS